ncbi:MAG: hypothetical protein K2Q22_16230, partial [Cytophagales bacterium]|nr:hypothetical protein [Cytophagales bacterium]
MFPFFTFSTKFEFERRIFFDVNLIALFSVVIISFYDLYKSDYKAVVFASLIAMPVYVGCLIFTYLVKELRKVIILQMVVAFTMVTFSFFNLDGFNGPFALDLMNLFMITAIITRRKIRPIYLILICGYAFGLIYIELFHSNLIQNIRPHDPPII